MGPFYEWEAPAHPLIGAAAAFLENAWQAPLSPIPMGGKVVQTHRYRELEESKKGERSADCGEQTRSGELSTAVVLKQLELVLWQCPQQRDFF